MDLHLRIVKEILPIHRVEIATNTLVGHSGIKDLLAVGLITAPLTVIQHFRAWLRHLKRG